MIKKILLIGLLLGAAAAVHAQQPGDAEKYAPLQDKPSCTRAELVKATDAYVGAQRRGNTTRMPLTDNARYLESMKTIKSEDWPLEHGAAHCTRHELS